MKMKKFTTTFFLLLAMVLLLPTEVNAADYYLIGDFNDWETNNTSYKFTVNGNKATATISAAAFSKNGTDNEVYFAVNAIDGSKKWYLKPSSSQDVTLGSTYDISSYYNTSSNSLCLKNPATSSTETYTVTLDFSSTSDINNSKLTITKSGSTDPKYYLYSGTSSSWDDSNGKELQLVDGKYEIEFTIPSDKTSGFYFCVFKGNALNWSNAIRPTAGSGADDNNTSMSGTINNSSDKVWLWETSSTDDVKLKLVLNGVENGNSWTLTNVTTPATTYTLKYNGTTDVIGSKSGDNYTFPIPQTAFVDGTGLSFTISDSEGKTYNPANDTELSNGVAISYAESGAGSWTCKEKANAAGYTVTLNTTDGKVQMTWSTSVTPPTPIPGTGENYYLVGNFFKEDGDAINYDRQIFRFEPDGTGKYSLDIPATLNVDCQIVSVKNGVVTIYGPNETVNVNTTYPTDNNSVNNTLATTTKGNTTNLWKFADRGINSDGIYTITLSESATKWTIKHNANKRMAFYLSTMPGATAQPSYTEEKGTLVNNNYDNRYFGYVYLEKGARCYVVSNLRTQQDSGNTELSKTTDKLYLQGTRSGIVSGGDDNALVYPNGTYAEESKPFTIGNTEEGVSAMLEYNSTQGKNSPADGYALDLGENASMSGRIYIASSTGVGDVELGEIKSMQILGPGVTGNWNVNEAKPMDYNPTERCWQATVYTTKEESVDNFFRFILNGSLDYNFGDDATKAKVPYLNEGATGVTALPSEPNEVIYHKESAGTTSDNMTGDHIIFNRPAGEWTVKFYITQEITGTGGQYTYNFKYTINGHKYDDVITIPSVPVGEKHILLRTYSTDYDCKPVDENVHVFVAHSFEKEGTDPILSAITGKVHLYEINYIPANVGVVLYAGEGNEALTVNLIKATDANTKDYTESKTTKESLWKWKSNHSGEEFNNDLVAVLTSTSVGPSVIENDEIVARNFGLGVFSKTDAYKEGDEDRIGFYRLKEGTMGANKAYLQYDNGQYGIDSNSQILDKDTDASTVTFSKVMLVFEGFEDDETTGIKEITSAVDKVVDGYYYNLQGIRVNNPSKGIYIHNGRKVIIK